MIIDRIHQWARVNPTKPALIHNGNAISYITFAKSIETLRKFLQAHNLPAGTIAVVLVDHLADAWVFVLALRALGLTTVHVQSFAHIRLLALKNVSCIVTTAREQQMLGVPEKERVGARLIVVSRSALAAAPAVEWPPPAQGDNPYGGHIRYTSGTTGDAKKLLWEGRLEDARTSARARFHGFNQDSVVHTLAYGLRTGIGWKGSLSVWQAGGCVVIDQRPERIEKFFSNAAITTAFMTPRPFKKLVTSDNFNSAPPGKCEFWVSGGFVGADYISKATARQNVTIYYSSGELATPVLSARVRDLDDAIWLHPAADRTIQIVDDHGHERLPGQEGDLRILTTEIDSKGYLDDPATTSRIFRDGFFYPGDRAIRRADGRIRVLGRTVDVLNVQGEKIAVRPIEQRIREFLKVDEVCLFSMLNEAGQDELVIAIQTEREPQKPDLDSIRRDFANFDSVRFLVLEEFPHAESGSTEKLRRAALRKLAFPKLEIEN